MSIVVTAATGQLGRLVVASLLDRGVDPAQIVATGRSTDRLTELAQQGVRADHTTLAIAPEHVATEQTLKASGVPYTILRNGWYTENYAPAFAQAAANGAVITSAGDGRISAATRQDFAEAAAAVLTGQGPDGATYELGGDTAFTMRELADTFTTVLDRPIELHNLSGEQHRAALLRAGLDQGTADFLVLLDRNTADGELATDTTDLSRLIGHPTTPVAETIATWHA